MLLYTIGQQSDTLVTLTESTTIDNPYYLFVFTNVSTKVVINKIVNSADDTSEFKDRINIYNFNTITLFQNAQAGQYSYEVYEQSSSTNTNINGLNMVECGKMLLQPAVDLIQQGYEPTTTYKGYAG
jgi:ABC-type transport system involved in Fe-S cluster assembly fused permease/ATPase subunit